MREYWHVTTKGALDEIKQMSIPTLVPKVTWSRPDEGAWVWMFDGSVPLDEIINIYGPSYAYMTYDSVILRVAVPDFIPTEEDWIAGYPSVQTRHPVVNILFALDAKGTLIWKREGNDADT